MKFLQKNLSGKPIFAFFMLFSSVLYAATAPDPAAYYINQIPGNFIDIAAAGNKLMPGDQQGISGIPIGFDFVFFAAVYNTVTVTSNGYLSFSSIINSRNTPLPSVQEPDNLLAPFWDYLNPPVQSGWSCLLYNPGNDIRQAIHCAMG